MMSDWSGKVPPRRADGRLSAYPQRLAHTARRGSRAGRRRGLVRLADPAGLLPRSRLGGVPLRRGLAGLPQWVANLPSNARFVAQDPAFQALYSQRTATWEQLVEQAKAEGSLDLQVSTAVLVRMMQRLFAPGYEDLIRRGRATPDESIHTLLTVILRGARSEPAS
jgi:hypothetical protein